MNYFSNKKISFWIVMAVIILNFTAIGTILYKLYVHPTENRVCNKMPCAQSYLESELKLSPVQAAEFKKLKEKHHDTVCAVNQLMKTKRNYLSENMTRPNPDTLMLMKTADEIGLLYAQIRKLYVMHYFQLWKVCDAQQQVKLASIFGKMFCSECRMGDSMPNKMSRHQTHGACSMHKDKY